MAAKKTLHDAATPAVVIKKLNIQQITVTLIGDSPLIMHAWSHKAKQEMLDKQMKRAKTAREAKDPDRDYRDSMYYLPESSAEKPRYGFPAIAFKSAAVDACSHADGITKVEARGAFHINQDMVEIHGTPQKREDMVKIAMGTADIRYRGEFPTWKAVIPIRYNASVLSEEQIVNLFEIAGFAIGIGEWRPARDGSMGMFHVERTAA